jgi:peptidoglycan/xylan/chitin deacetylase (PgdA/CDA1 family)
VNVLLLIENSDLAPEASWLLETLFHTLASEYKLHLRCYSDKITDVVNSETILISWGMRRPDRRKFGNKAAVEIHIEASERFITDRLPPVSSPREVKFEKFSCLSFYSGAPKPSLRRESHGRWIIQTDLLATVFFLLSRMEEWGSGPRDRYGRFADEYTWSFKNDLTNRPIVDEIRAFLDYLIAVSYKPVPRVRLWKERPLAFYLSHDIDQIRYSTMKGIIRHPLRTANLTRSWSATLKSVNLAAWGMWDHTLDPYWPFYYLQRLYRQLKIRGSFFILPRRTCRLEPYNLLVEGRLIRAITAMASRINSEIGLHSTFSGAEGGANFERDCDAFESVFHYPPDGVRSHYLRFMWPATLRALEDAKIHFDTSLGFSAVPGFRCGTSHPFYLFDLERHRQTSILEIPLTIMDVTLKHHLQCDVAQAREKSLALLRKVHHYNGVYTLLWHTESLLCPIWEPWRRDVFEWLLHRGKAANAHFLTGELINQRCREVYRKVEQLKG